MRNGVFFPAVWLHPSCSCHTGLGWGWRWRHWWWGWQPPAGWCNPSVPGRERVIYCMKQAGRHLYDIFISAFPCLCVCVCVCVCDPGGGMEEMRCSAVNCLLGSSPQAAWLLLGPQPEHETTCKQCLVMFRSNYYHRLNLVKSAMSQKWFFWCFFIRNDLSKVGLIIKVVLNFLSDL